MLLRYAALVGVDLPPRDLVRALAAHGGPSPPDTLVKALQAVGVAAQVLRAPGPHPDLWPALVPMTNGHLALVLEQKGDALSIADGAHHDLRVEVPVSQFLPFYGGFVLRAVPGAAMQGGGRGAGADGGHRVWSRIARVRLRIGALAVGALVVNLLAVAAAFAALRIWDAAVPDRFGAGAWMVAVGIGLGVLVDLVLRAVRARLWPGAGRQPDGAGRPAAMRGAFFDALVDLPFAALVLAVLAFMGGDVVWVAVAGGLGASLSGFLLHRPRPPSRGAVAAPGNPSPARGVGILRAAWVLAVVATVHMAGAGPGTMGALFAVGILTDRILAPLMRLAVIAAWWRRATGGPDSHPRAGGHRTAPPGHAPEALRTPPPAHAAQGYRLEARLARS